MNGWRPISVTYQPATVATQPENVIADSHHSSARGSRSAAQPRVDTTTSRASWWPASAGPCRPSRERPRTPANTGGCWSRKSSSPLHLGVEIVAQDQARAVRAPRSRSRFARAAPSGMANSSSGAPRVVCQRPSIAAIFAGWCSSVFRPCWSPTKICSGISSAASVSPTRSTFGARTRTRVPLSSCQARQAARAGTRRSAPRRAACG